MDKYFGGSNVTTDFITVAHSNIIEIGRFHCFQAYIDDLTVGTLNTSGGGGSSNPPKVAATHDVWDAYGPSTVSASATDTTVATIKLNTGSWILRLMVSGTASSGVTDFVQWHVLASVANSSANVMTILPFVTLDTVKNGTLSATSPVVSLVDGGSGNLLIKVNTTVVPMKFRVYSIAMASNY